MAKFTLTNPLSGGDLLPNAIDQARVQRVDYDYRGDRIDVRIELGSESDGIYKPAPFQPLGNLVVRNIGDYPDLLAAWNNFARKVFQHAASESVLPEGTDSD